MFERCTADGADLVSLRSRTSTTDGVQYLFCPACSTAVLVLGPLGKPYIRLRYRYRKGDLFLLDPDDERALPHLDPFREAIARFDRTGGLPFDPFCVQDGSRVPIVAEAERVKLVWCGSCRLGTAYLARPRYGWTVAGTFGWEEDGSRYSVRDYRGPDDLYPVIESAMVGLPKPA